MSQQQPPGWTPGRSTHPGQPDPRAQGYNYGPPAPPQPPAGGGTGVVVVSVVAAVFALLLLGFFGVAGLALYAKSQEETAQREAVRERQRVDSEAAAEAAREAARLEAKRAKLEAEKARARTGELLTTSDLGYYDKGIINDYRQLVSVTLLNRSKFPVMNMMGDVEWMTDNGTRIASMPFVLKGSITPGATKRFTVAEGTLENGTVQTNATKARLRFTNVEIVE